MSDLWNPLWLSLRVAACATVLVAVVAVPLAWLMGRRRFPGKSVIETLITVPLVMPPTVVGYLIIMALGSRGWVGRWLNEAFGYSIVFRFEGAVLASARHCRAATSATGTISHNCGLKVRTPSSMPASAG